MYVHDTVVLESLYSEVMCQFFRRILTSQFPPALTEKIAVVGGGAIPLDQYSILEGEYIIIGVI